jgi:hypothetical protein
MRSHVWSLLAALLRVLLVRGAGPDPDPSPECGDKDVRLFTSISDSNPISAALDGVVGDAHGVLEICENELWKRVVLCSEGVEQWTTENTAVACRELGYPAPGQSGAYDVQMTEEGKRLSYVPQCMGSEDRLRNCTTVDHGDSCAIPVVISCWNSSQVTTIHLSPSLAVTPFTSSASKPAVSPPFSLLQSSPNAVSATELQQPSLTTGPASTPTTDSPSTDNTTTDPPSTAPQALVYLAATVGTVVALLLLSIAGVVLYPACHRREKVRPQNEPYEVPVSTSARNQTFQEVPETEVLYDRATTSVQREDSQEYHTLNHSLSPSKPSPPLSSHSTGSSTGPPPVYDTVVPPASSQARDPPTQKPPVYYHVLQSPTERAVEVKYHTLEEPAGHRYHVLEQQETGGVNTSGGPAMYSEVGQRRAVTLQPHRQAPSASNLTVSLPRNLSGSTTLL